ncbi:MAG: hypothetical protein J6J36_04235 [Clostridia bacterium]|nr:hypothetical protein [Clostridia bacterium]
MGNIDINRIWKKGFPEDSLEANVEAYCRKMASERTDKLLKCYSALKMSRGGRYINSDLLKMVYPFYAGKFEHRERFNTAITNSAAVLTSEVFSRAVRNPEVDKCIFVLGPYGAGKSYFVQSVFEVLDENDFKGTIVYEGSITPPAFNNKVQEAIDNGLFVEVIAINPTLELSMRNIRAREKQIGRGVERKEVLDKFSNFHRYFVDLTKAFPSMPYTIYSKDRNKAINLQGGSYNLEELNHGTPDEIAKEYDRIIAILNKEDGISEEVTIPESRRIGMKNR